MWPHILGDWIVCVCVCVCVHVCGVEESFISSLLLKFYVYYSAQNLARQVFPFTYDKMGALKKIKSTKIYIQK